MSSQDTDTDGILECWGSLPRNVSPSWQHFFPLIYHLFP